MAIEALEYFIRPVWSGAQVLAIDAGCVAVGVALASYTWTNMRPDASSGE